ncbi:N-acetylmuramoyl-L-alanine amidase [Desulforamulus aeronauticus]|uniref:N-acetylmuramoyl-L-alanine amidase n=1 Tax=Desulforamulus aeronauticus DSM 10349 TaxID=1121421 RepID=A0A1M6SFF2_9FIRM|nr:N-acetylmuramoyl-L-alanine amidase [Desulforamulus aeronauticus]SHK43426.1 N-acetylmuramoyl-L-alanine amidase [Desulforamulus aeronauticus DSM 10349]
MTFISGSRFFRYAVLMGLGITLIFHPMGGLQLADAAQVATVTADKLNLRSGPGTHTAAVGQVYKGNQLPVLSKSGDWYQVQSGGKSVWVASWLVKVQETANVSQGSSSSKVAVVKGSILNIRSGPGTGYGVAGKAKQGDKLTVLSQSGDWYKIQSGNTTGWVANWLVTIQQAPVTPTTPAPSSKVAVINTDTINLRSGPGTSHSVAGQVSRGVRLPVISRSGDWVQVRQTNGSNAWVAGWLVAVEEQQETPQPPAKPVEGSWLPAPTDNGTGNQPGEQTPTPTVPTTKLVDVKVTEKQGTTYVNIVSEKAITYNTFTLSNPSRYVVNISDVQVGKLPETILAQTELVDKVRTGNPSQDPYITRLVLDMKKAGRVKTSLSADKKTLTLEVSKISYSDGLQGKTVFLDAGHGGYDNGASGQKGLREKDVNLAITLKVAELLKNQGANVIFSRDTDTFVDLYERTRLANVQNSDIFVSIHSNANLNRAIGGTSTYFYAPESTPYLYEQKGDRQRLAQAVQRELVATLGRRDIGVLQSNFAVLRTSTMPSILIETAFVSNAEEEALLASEGTRQRAAEAIARGIGAYFSGQ